MLSSELYRKSLSASSRKLELISRTSFEVTLNKQCTKLEVNVQEMCHRIVSESGWGWFRSCDTKNALLSTTNEIVDRFVAYIRRKKPFLSSILPRYELASENETSKLCRMTVHVAAVHGPCLPCLVLLPGWVVIDCMCNIVACPGGVVELVCYDNDYGIDNRAYYL